MTPASVTKNEGSPRAGSGTRVAGWSLRRVPLAPPDTALALALALCIIAVVFVVRLLSDDPGTAVLTLYVVPILLVAAAIGLAAGVATAGFCLATVALWELVGDVEVNLLGYVVRGAVFSTAAVVGAAVRRGASAGAQAVTTWLPEGARSASVAREVLMRFDESLSDERLQDAQLLATELVANAIEHGKGIRIELRAELGGDRLRVEVIDHGRELLPSAPGEDRVGGLGLQLVDTISDDWGAWHGGSSAWFQLPRQ